LSGFVLPTPKDGEQGAWVNTATAPGETLRGCKVGDLPYWLDDELWNIELAGTLVERGHLILAGRARLLSRIDTWVDQLAWEFVATCARRVVQRAAAALRDAGRADAAASLEEAGDLEELELAANAAADQPGHAQTLAGYVADVCFYARDAGVPARGACVAAKMSAYAVAATVEDVHGFDERLANERAWQAAWLVDRLGL
jgi:hypothetical protein